ncbi:M24 family metallopeptidase [Lactobacillaceae bacterium Scapto_B20]
MSKIESVQKWTAEQGADFTYISDPKTIEYLTGFFSDPIERVLALVVFADQEPFMFAPALEVEVVKDSGFDHPVYGYLDHENPWRMIGDYVKKRVADPKHIALDKGYLPVAREEALQSVFSSAAFDSDITSFIEHMRLYKTADEIAKLEAAGREADFAFEQGFAAVEPGVSEMSIAAKLEYELKLRGVRNMSFDTLVQAGAHAANPHGATSDNKVKNNELVLFDLGTFHDGYISDASRTVAVGKPSDKDLDIYKVCLEAQLKAMDAAKPGITAEELDAVARDVIDKAGYGQYFIHRLGHGMGMSEHEFPSIMEGNKMELEPGMCFSIEPGIYIPGVAGVRIEDCVYLTENEAKPFTHTPKDLIYVDK